MSSNGKLAIDGGTPVRTEPYPPWPHFWEDEIEAVKGVLEARKVNYWTGTYGREFQDLFADFCGVKHAVAVSNGTAALHVALAAVQISPGDEVILPSWTFVATAAAVMQQNAIPIFADVDPLTNNISPASIEQQITPATKGIIVVHLAGHPCDMGPIMALAEKHNLFVIEDSAQSHGAEYDGKRTGNLGHVGAFSFCNDKQFTTGGEGGMVTMNDEDMAERARSFKDHGYQEKERRSLLELEALYTYIHHSMGYNYRMTEMQAAIGVTHMKNRLDWNLQRRIENAHYLKEKLGAVNGLQPPHEADNVKHTFYKWYGKIEPEKMTCDRDTFVKAVRAEGIPVGLGSAPMNYKEEVFQQKVGVGRGHHPFDYPTYINKDTLDYSKVECPVAVEEGKKVFVLQVHPTIEQKDLENVVEAFTKVAEAYAK
jgi:dTDP-4-amino-4,6-dideoxygalactose transaminase